LAHANQTKSARTETAPRVLLYDLETSPIIGYTWGTWETDVIKIIQQRQIISFAWKWLGESKVNCLALPDFPGYIEDKKNNRPLIMALHKLFSQADIVVGHNVKKFDDKRSMTDFIRHKLPPPPPHKQVDTLEFARSKFDFTSNRLDDLGQFLELGRKVKHPGFEMWEGCLAGERESWALMRKYNKQDVALLEKIYLRLRPYMMRHPNMSAPEGLEGCPVCKSKKLERRGWNISQKGKAPRFQCQDCGKWSSGSFILKDRRWRFT